MVTVKVALVDPAATATFALTCAAAVLLLDSVTVAPPEGAGPFSVTVPVELFPPITLVGLTATEDRATPTGVTVRVAVWVAP